jgi:hypothetical protein
MPSFDALTDYAGNIICRYCRYAKYLHHKGYWVCRVGDNPGKILDVDHAECEYGELAHESEHYERMTQDG